MPEKNLPANLSDVDKLFATTPIEESTGESTVPTQAFSSFMKTGASPMETAGKTTMISPFDLMQSKPALAQTPTLETLTAQVNHAQSTMGDLYSQMSTPNLKLKASQKYLLKNKLTDANVNLRNANAKMGAEEQEEPDNARFKGPLGKFFGYLTDGANQLKAAKKQLQSLKDKGENLTPGDFLLIQVKLNKATQELEYASVLLSNAVSSFKMLMQVQL